uniref:Uncharacterized protein n=1 Tax=Zea mays TaxID=4577 RepID=C4J8P1_MAIZE|nr:unknown [Zea mays]
MAIAGLTISRPSLAPGCSKRRTSQEGSCTSPHMHPGADRRRLSTMSGRPARLPVQPLPRRRPASASPRDPLGGC